MPTIPLPFCIVMTVIMKDVDNQQPTHEERNIFSSEQPIGMNGHDKLLYAGDTLILASSRQAAEIMLHKI